MGTSLRRPSSTSSMNSANWAGMHLTRRWQRRLGKKLIAWTERLQYCASSGLPYSALCSRIAISHVPILDDLPRASGTVVDRRRSEGGDGRPALSRADHQILSRIVLPMVAAWLATGDAGTVGTQWRVAGGGGEDGQPDPSWDAHQNCQWR